MKTEQESSALKEIDIHQLFAEIIAAKWFVVITVIVFFILGLLYAVTRSPTYQTSALIQMNKSNESMSNISSLASLMGSFTSQQMEATPAMIESTLLQSRYVLEPVISSLHLDIIANEHHFPLTGHFYTPVKDAIVVDNLTVPDVLLEKRLSVIKTSDHTYSVYDPQDNLLTQGSLGVALVSQQNPQFQVTISQLKGAVGTRYNLEKLRMENALVKIQKSFVVNTNNPTNMSSTDTGVLTLTYTATSPDAAVTILNSILTTAYTLGIQQQSAEAQHVIDFLTQQIPQVKSQLSTAENTLSDYQAKTGNLGIDAQAQVLLQNIVAVNQQLEQLKLDRSELLEKYTMRHPFVQVVNDKISTVQKELDALQQEVHNLPEADKVAVSLLREVKTKDQLYLLLLSKLQEMQVLSAGVVSNMKILDTAYTPPTILPPHRSLIAVISLILGLLVSIAVIIMKMLLRNGIQDPSTIEELFGIPVNAIIPHSKQQEKLNSIIRQSTVKRPHILAQESPQDISIEAIRSLRTSLQLAMINKSSNVICISGLTPGIGKSFISLNLAYTLAQTNKDILLIDVDIRKGKIHKSFGIEPSPGISDHLAKHSQTHDFAIYTHPDLPNLHFIPRGSIHKNPAELLQSDGIQELLTALRKDYKTIIIDTPPILAVSDPIHIMKLADINFLVLSAGQHTNREMSQAMNLLKINNIKPDGAVFNFSKITSATTYYYYTGYSYKSYDAYKNEKPEEDA